MLVTKMMRRSRRIVSNTNILLLESRSRQNTDPCLWSGLQFLSRTARPIFLTLGVVSFTKVPVISFLIRRTSCTTATNKNRTTNKCREPVLHSAPSHSRLLRPISNQQQRPILFRVTHPSIQYKLLCRTIKAGASQSSFPRTRCGQEKRRKREIRQK